VKRGSAHPQKYTALGAVHDRISKEKDGNPRPFGGIAMDTQKNRAVRTPAASRATNDANKRS